MRKPFLMMSSEITTAVQEGIKLVIVACTGPLAAQAGATSMIDVSDGLVRDGARIATASGVELALDEEVLECIESLSVIARDTSMLDAFVTADDVLRQAIQGISDLILVPGIINLDFADVKTIMSGMGFAIMGTGIAEGETRAMEAANRAISSPLLEDASVRGARGVIINVTGGTDLSLMEVNEASCVIQEAAHEEANIIFGAVIDEGLAEGELRVTVIATGLDGGRDGVVRPERLPLRG